MKINQHVGNKNTILFAPDISIEGDTVTIPSHKVHIRGEEYEIPSQSFNLEEIQEKELWFNFDGYVLGDDLKSLRPGAFKFLRKHGEEYHVIRYAELPPPVIETPTEISIPTVENVKETLVKPVLWERVKKFVWRK